MSLFFVDSRCDLSQEEIEKLGIELISETYSFEGENTAFDGDFQKFYSKVRKGLMIETSDLTEKYYEKVFKMAFERGDDIIYVHPSENIFALDKIKKTREKLLKKYPDRIFQLIDSNSFSCGHGIICYELAKLYRNGATINEIVEASYDIRRAYIMYLAIDSVEPLLKRELLDKNAVSTGSTLNLKNIISVDMDGNFQVVERVNGKKKAIAKLIEYIRQTGENVADYPIGVCYSDNHALEVELRDKINEYFGKDIRLFETQITPNNLCICGLGAIGICFHTKRKQ